MYVCLRVCVCVCVCTCVFMYVCMCMCMCMPAPRLLMFSRDSTGLGKQILVHLYGRLASVPAL